MSQQITLSTSYRIEISGWDVEQSFFVEKTDLDWSEEQGKKVQLHHQLRNGAVVFIRLIAPTASGHSFPIAYQIENVGPAKSAGAWEVRLVQLRPRSGANGKWQAEIHRGAGRETMRKTEATTSARTDRLCTWEEFRRATGTCPVIMEELGRINGGVYEIQTEPGKLSEVSEEGLEFLSNLGPKKNKQLPN